MRTRTLVMLVAVVAVVALAAVVILGDGDGALRSWFERLHGRPGGGH